MCVRVCVRVPVQCHSYSVKRQNQPINRTTTFDTYRAFVSKRQTSNAFALPRRRVDPSMNSVKVIWPSPLSRNSKRLSKSWYSSSNLGLFKPQKAWKNAPTQMPEGMHDTCQTSGLIFVGHVRRLWDMFVGCVSGRHASNTCYKMHLRMGTCFVLFNRLTSLWTRERRYWDTFVGRTLWDTFVQNMFVGHVLWWTLLCGTRL